MAIKGKKAYKLYLDEENYEYVKRYVDTTFMAGGMSGMINEIVGQMADTLRSSGVSGDSPVSFAKVLRVFFEGIKRT